MPAAEKKNTAPVAVAKKAEKETVAAPAAEVEVKKTASKKVAAPAEAVAAPSSAAVEAKPKKATKKTEEAAPAAPAPVAAAASSSEEAEVETAEKTRRVVTKESVQASFQDLIDEINAALVAVQSTDAKFNVLRFVRSMRKRVTVLRSDVNRVAKVKTRNAGSRPANSGFMKPVAISKDLAKFTGWDAAQQRSRVDVTKFICQYVKDHNLQDPNDKRLIIPDQKLAKLLNYDPKKEKDAEGKDIPLTYYHMQRKLKAHFPASVEAAQ